MSQKKVDQYKEYKANKKKILKKEKVRKKLVDWLVYIIILVVGTAVLTVAVGQGMYQYKRFMASRPDYTAEGRVIEDLARILVASPTPEPTEDGSEEESESEKTTEKETESEKESASEKESEQESVTEKESVSEQESVSEKESEQE